MKVSLLAAMMVFPVAAYGQATVVQQSATVVTRSTTVLRVAPAARAVGVLEAAEAVTIGRALAVIGLGFGAYLLLKPDPEAAARRAEQQRARVAREAREALQAKKDAFRQQFSSWFPDYIYGSTLDDLIKVAGEEQLLKYMKGNLALISLNDRTSAWSPRATYASTGLFNNANRVEIFNSTSTLPRDQDGGSRAAGWGIFVDVIDVKTGNKEDTTVVALAYCRPVNGNSSDPRFYLAEYQSLKPCLQIYPQPNTLTAGLKRLEVTRPKGYQIRPQFAYVLPIPVGKGNQ